jgi:hypothetical protein
MNFEGIVDSPNFLTNTMKGPNFTNAQVEILMNQHLDESLNFGQSP